MVGSAFPTKTDTPKKLVGAYVDEAHAHHLSLISLINDESKSVILTAIINDYLAKQPSTDTLVKEAAKRAIDHWEAHGWCGKRTSTAFQAFREGTVKQLKKHRISVNLINLILKEIQSGISSKAKSS